MATFNPSHRIPAEATLTERTRFVMELLHCTNREATHVLWECGFSMGTDRATWLIERDCITFLTRFRNADCQARFTN